MQAVLEYTEGAFQPGTHIGPYRLIKHLKQGGMSTVYLGYHIRTRAYVAIKVVDSYSVDLQMLYREIEVMQALQHEHIVPCLDAGQYGRYHYLVMPYLQGGTLEDTLNGNVLTLEDQQDIDLAVHWVLKRPGIFLNTVGDIHVLPKVLDAASRFRIDSPGPTDEQMEALVARLGMVPLFV